MPFRVRGNVFEIDVTFKGRRKYATADTQADAEEAEKRLLATMQAEALEAGKLKPWKLSDAVDKTRAIIWAGKRSEKNSRIHSQQILDHFGRATKLDEITSDSIDDYKASLVKLGNSNGTINRKLACLSRIFSFAKQRGGLQSKPHIQKERESLGRIRWITDTEEETILRLLTQWGKGEQAQFCSLLLETGMRTGELYALEARDCDLANEMLSIWKSKNGDARSIPMTTLAKSILTEAITLRPCGRLFPYSSDWWLRQQWERVKDVMGLQGDSQFVPHCLRHTFASRLVQRGTAIQVVKELMGHKTLMVTLRYAHLAPKNLKAAMACLERSTPQSST